MAMSGVFLSHSSQDKALVRIVAADLIVSGGVVVWLDEAEIRIGDSLIRKIGEGISGVDHVAAFLSRHSIASEWVVRELEVALTREINGKRVIVLPLLIGDITNDEIPTMLLAKYYGDLRDPERYWAELGKLTARVKPDARNTDMAPRPDLRDELLADVGLVRLSRELVQGDDRRRADVARELCTLRPKPLGIILMERSALDPHGVVRHWINQTLGRLDLPEAVPVLKRNVTDSDPFAALGAEDALRWLADHGGLRCAD